MCPVQVSAADSEVREAGKVGGLADSLVDQRVVLVLSVQTAQGALARVGHGEKALSKPPEPVAVAHLGQVPLDHLPEGEGIQKLVPQQNVFSAQLRDVTVGL